MRSIDLRSDRYLGTDESTVQFVGNNETVEVSVLAMRELFRAFPDNKIMRIRMLRLIHNVSLPIISLKLCKEIVEWFEDNDSFCHSSVK